MPDRNAQWTIGTLIAVAIAMSMQTSGLRADINQLRNEISEFRNEMNQQFNQIRNEMN